MEAISDRTANQQHLAPTGVVDGQIDSASEAWLYLSVDIGPNQSRARAVKLGKNDQMTFHNLRATYRSFTPKWCWWKQATKIKFYRVCRRYVGECWSFKFGLMLILVQFHGFLFKEPQDCLISTSIETRSVTLRLRTQYMLSIVTGPGHGHLSYLIPTMRPGITSGTQ